MAATLALAGSANPFPAQDHPVTAAQHYANFVAAITATVPTPIGIYAEAIDVEERAQHVDAVMKAAMEYVAAIVRDTAASSSAHIDCAYIAGCMDDYRGEATGELIEAANQLWRDESGRRVA